jgi:hypothetical protein
MTASMAEDTSSEAGAGASAADSAGGESSPSSAPTKPTPIAKQPKPAAAVAEPADQAASDPADTADDPHDVVTDAGAESEGVKATMAEPVLVDAEPDEKDAFSWSSSSWSSTWEPEPAKPDHVPFPADEVGKPKASGPVAASAASDAADSLTPADGTPARSVFEPARPSASDTSAVDRIGAAASAVNSKLDLNGKLDRGRQAWRQMTGPNSWLSNLTSGGSGNQEQAADATAPAGYSGSGYGNSSYSTPVTRADQASPAPAGGSGYDTASYGGPAADATMTAAAVAAGHAGTPLAPAGYPGAGQSSYSRTVAPGRQAPQGVRASRPAGSVKAAKRRDSRRQAQLTLARVEPWSVMKFSFVVSVVAFIVLFVAVALLYMVLSSLGVFASLQHTIDSLTSAKNQAGTNVSSWFSPSRVLGYTGMLGALNIVLITAMSTIGAVIYNLIAHTIGGIEVTLRETD